MPPETHPGDGPEDNPGDGPEDNPGDGPENSPGDGPGNRIPGGPEDCPPDGPEDDSPDGPEDNPGDGPGYYTPGDPGGGNRIPAIILEMRGLGPIFGVLESCHSCNVGSLARVVIWPVDDLGHKPNCRTIRSCPSCPAASDNKISGGGREAAARMEQTGLG